jgi:hypothetical protein
MEPVDGAPATQETSFKVIYDDDHLYVLIRAWDTEPDRIVRQLSRRDNIEADFVSINIDSYNDRLTAFCFGVTAAGVKADEMITNDDDEDDTYDPVWYVKTSVDSLGWLAEMKIPFTQIRFGKQEAHEWGLEVWRWLFREEEVSLWQHIPATASGMVSKFGTLTGIRDITPRREVEIMPYIMGKIETYKKEEGNPYADGVDPGWSAGVDGKIAVTNDFTVNLSVNPDFGQVEADPSEVNLTTFETFFPERRPFFVEGSNIFNYRISTEGGSSGRDILFYSRRVGRPPHFDPDLEDGEFASIPEATRILGAAKLSGKTRNGWSVGVMEGFANEEEARISREGEERTEVTEPFTNYFNTRVQKDFNQGIRSVGGMFTATNRFISDSNLYYLPAAAYAGGMDYVQYWKEKNYYLRAKAVFSHLAGDQEAILELQESPLRYYQRPDATHLRVDSSLTSLTGHGGSLAGGKIGGGHFSYGAFVTWRSPGLELNDQGYQRVADEIQQVVWSDYKITKPVSIFRSLEVFLNEYSNWDFSWTRTLIGIEGGFGTTFTNYWSFFLAVNRDAPNLNRKELRGGPALKMGGDLNMSFEFESDERRKLILSINSFSNWGDWAHSRFTNIGGALTWKPVKSLALSAGPEYTLGHRTSQYVETLEYKGEPRYIVSRIDQEVIRFDLRIDLSITPDISLQYWGQPFVFAGDYSEFKQVVNPGIDDYYRQFDQFNSDRITLDPESNIYSVDEDLDGDNDYSFENPDFKFYEFQSNLVFRWEYIPGSVLYFVWSQRRQDDSSFGEFDFDNDVNRMFATYPANVFLLKLSYRISI